VTLPRASGFPIILLFFIFSGLEACMITKLGPKYSEKITAHFAIIFIFAAAGLYF